MLLPQACIMHLTPMLFDAMFCFPRSWIVVFETCNYLPHLSCIHDTNRKTFRARMRDKHCKGHAIVKETIVTTPHFICAGRHCGFRRLRTTWYWLVSQGHSGTHRLKAKVVVDDWVRVIQFVQWIRKCNNTNVAAVRQVRMFPEMRQQCCRECR